jgi:RteC protein
MKSYTEKLHNELLVKLDELDRNYDPLMLTDPRLNIISSAIDQVKEKLKTYQFKYEKDEIHYFKSVLPKTLALYIYYSDKIEWDRTLRQGRTECITKLSDKLFLQAETFREEHKVIYEYHRDERTDMDHLYFMRKSPLNREVSYQLLPIIDPSSPPLHCKLLAMNIAYSRMENELKILFAEIKGESGIKKKSRVPCKWTGKVIDLVELNYGLHGAGSINNGNASLKDIKECLEEAFDVDLGNTSSYFQDIIRRKNGSTTFLDLMKAKLLQRIDDFLN